MLEESLGNAINNSINETATAFFLEDFQIRPGPVVVKQEDQPYSPPQADLTARVGFSGRIKGGIHLSAPLHVALGLASAFTGECVDEANDEALVAFGELSKIIAGAVKSHISDEILLTPPLVISGIENSIEYVKKMESTRCYFNSKAGPFFVEVFHRYHASHIVEDFKKEHQKLLDSFEAIKKLGIESREGVRTFWTTEDLLIGHLINEDARMYPILRKSAETDLGLAEILSQFSEKMSNIFEIINTFSKDLIAGINSKNLAEMNNTLDQIGNVLMHRIRLEEAVIYPAFERLDNNPE
jgi:chemotaxis protein CheX